MKPSEHSPIEVSRRHRTVWPSFKWTIGNPARFLMFGLGSGLLRPGSGTWGTLAAWFIWLLVAPYLSNTVIGCSLVISFLFGCWACGVVGKSLGAHDHVGIVWDEFVAFWLVLWLVPSTFLWQLVGFGLFRYFDIAKPPPIKQLDAKIGGGMGVMVDDIVAAAYTLLVVAIMVRMGVKL